MYRSKYAIWVEFLVLALAHHSFGQHILFWHIPQELQYYNMSLKFFIVPIVCFMAIEAKRPPVFANDPTQRALCREHKIQKDCGAVASSKCSWNDFQNLCNEYGYQPVIVSCEKWCPIKKPGLYGWFTSVRRLSRKHDLFWTLHVVHTPPITVAANKDDLVAKIGQCLAKDASGNTCPAEIGPMGDWDVSKVAAQYMPLFLDKYSFNADISKWDIKFTTTRSLFSRSIKFNQDISKWDVSRVTDMGMMFQGAANKIMIFNQDISKWDVSKVTDMSWMFAFSNAFNADISKWDVSKNNFFCYMFYLATAFDRTLCGKWKTAFAAATCTTKMFTSSKGKLC